MSIRQQLMQYGQRKLTRKLVRAIPWVGSVIAIVTVGATMRKKGVVRGAADSALDFIPYIGGVKNTLEVARGRDFIPDKAAGRA